MHAELECSNIDGVHPPEHRHRIRAAANARLAEDGRIPLPAFRHFDAKLNFYKDSNLVNIEVLGKRFRTHLHKKVEHDVPEGTLRAYTLLRRSADISILGDLGERSVIYLADLWHLLLLHNSGEESLLIDTGRPNICYVRDVTDTLIWTVYLEYRRDYGAWCIGASPVTCPTKWSEGTRVLSR